MQAKGKFDVTLTPLESSTQGEKGMNLARMSIDKTFHGDLDATSVGEMLSVMTPVQGSAGYVAMEQVTGKLNDAQGSFVLQHYGMMSGGTNKLTLEVVPNSGTDDLSSLAGSMSINITDGQHYYEFEYTI